MVQSYTLRQHCSPQAQNLHARAALRCRSIAIWMRAAAAAAITLASAAVAAAVVCYGSVYAFDDAPGTDIIGYTSLPSNYGGGALTWTDWNVINGTLWGSVRSDPACYGLSAVEITAEDQKAFLIRSSDY